MTDHGTSSTTGTEAQAGSSEVSLTAASAEPTVYVTEISVPSFGDGGIQRLHSRMLPLEPEPEAQ